MKKEGANLRQLLVAGGGRRFVLGKFANNLVEEGGWVVWHVEGYREEGSPFTGIPAGCQGVICLVDMMGHGACGKVTDAAKAAGIPYAHVPRKWASALPVLLNQGVLPPKVTNEKKGPTEDEIEQYLGGIDGH